MVIPRGWLHSVQSSRQSPGWAKVPHAACSCAVLGSPSELERCCWLEEHGVLQRGPVAQRRGQLGCAGTSLHTTSFLTGESCRCGSLSVQLQCSTHKNNASITYTGICKYRHTNNMQYVLNTQHEISRSQWRGESSEGTGFSDELRESSVTQSFSSTRHSPDYYIQRSERKNHIRQTVN